MPVATVEGIDLAYDVVGDGDETWTINPGGRFSKDYEGIRELADGLAAHGKRVLVWDRPNCGESSVWFDGASETEMNADALAGLLGTLDLAPAVITGGSGGSRSALATVARHPDIATGLALWLVNGGTFGLMRLAVHYYGDSIFAAWNGGMEAVVELPEWAEVLARNPANRARMLDIAPREFIETLERWMAAYPPTPDQLIPGVPTAQIKAISVPALIFRSSDSDPLHTRATSEKVAELIPRTGLVEPPWSEREWLNRIEGSERGESWCQSWPLLVPALIGWSRTISAAAT